MAKHTNEQWLCELREPRRWTRDEGQRVFDAWGGERRDGDRVRAVHGTRPSEYLWVVPEARRRADEG